MKLPTLVEVQYLRLPKKAKKSIINYIKHRILELDAAAREIKTRPEFHGFEDFVAGRSIEVVEILEMLQFMSKKKGKK